VPVVGWTSCHNKKSRKGFDEDERACVRNAKLGAGQYTASVIPSAKLSVYDGIGHSPFYEDAPRFNTELATFVRAAAKTN